MESFNYNRSDKILMQYFDIHKMDFESISNIVLCKSAQHSMAIERTTQLIAFLHRDKITTYSLVSKLQLHCVEHHNTWRILIPNAFIKIIAVKKIEIASRDSE